MKKFCPHCHCELLERASLYVCPRNAIGDCVYDAMQPDPLAPSPSDEAQSGFEIPPSPFESQSK